MWNKKTNKKKSSQICGDLERVPNFNPKKMPEIQFNSGLSFGIKDGNLPNKPSKKPKMAG